MPSLPIVRFGPFVLDGAAYELRHEGRPVRIERQPLDLLLLLVERRRQLVTRDEIADRIWGPGVFVDADAGIHTAVRKVRQALRDSPDRPVYVETVPGRGYRFIAEVEDIGTPAPAPAADEGPLAAPPAPEVLPVEPVEETTPPPSSAPPARAGGPRATRGLALAIGAMLLGGVAWWGWVAWGRTPAPAPPSAADSPLPATIAVLPFANLSGNRDYDYIAEGLADETSTALGQIDPERLGVVPPTAARRVAAAEKTTAEIGRELGVDLLVESTLRVEGPRLRVNSRLVRVTDQLQLWSQAWDREPTSMLGVQRELSEAIADQIRLRLPPDGEARLASRQPASADAYDLYLRGRNFENQRTPETTRRAVEYYTKATVIDPDYALAWAAISRTLAGSLLNGDASPLVVLPRARDAARRAIATGPATAEAQHMQAYMQWCCDWQWAEAEAGFRRALAINPRASLSHLVLGHALSQMGRHREARESMRRAREFDPLEPLAFALSSQVSFQARDYEAAIEWADRAIALDGEFWIGYMMRGQALERLGRYDAALEALTPAERFSGRNSKPLSLRAFILARMGRASQAEAIRETLETVSRDRYIPPYAFALIHAGLGHSDEVMTWLDRAADARDVHAIYLPVDPKWDEYRDDARFKAVLARCGFSRGDIRPGPRSPQ